MKKLQKKTSSRKIIILALIIIFLLIGANLIVTNTLATTGERLENLQNRRNNLKEQNNLLNGQILELSSLGKIKERAIQIGMINTEQIVTLNPQETVAMHQP